VPSLLPTLSPRKLPRSLSQSGFDPMSGKGNFRIKRSYVDDQSKTDLILGYHAGKPRGDGGHL
jgi:hypothetical protein